MEIEISRRRRGRIEGERAAALKADVAQMAAAGCSSSEIARSLGIHVHTVYRWRKEVPGGGFRRVHVTQPVPVQVGTVSLVTPGGYRVEGLSLEQVAMLLRAL